MNDARLLDRFVNLMTSVVETTGTCIMGSANRLHGLEEAIELALRDYRATQSQEAPTPVSLRLLDRFAKLAEAIVETPGTYILGATNRLPGLQEALEFALKDYRSLRAAQATTGGLPIGDNKRKAMCLHCGFEVFYEPFDTLDQGRAWVALLKHDQEECPKNPLLAKIAEQRGLLVRVDSYLDDEGLSGPVAQDIHAYLHRDTIKPKG